MYPGIKYWLIHVIFQNINIFINKSIEDAGKNKLADYDKY
jgi:hypothetical protein